MGLKAEQYDEIMRAYDRERIKNEHIRDSRLNDVYLKVPEYKALEDDVRLTAVDCGQRALSGDKAALFEMRNKLSEIEAKMQRLLSDNGFAPDYADYVYTCSDCKDTGYINGKKCHCLKQRILKKLYSQSNIEAVLEKENFDTLTYDYYNDSDIEKMRDIIDKCKDFVNSFDDDYRNIFFTGKPGVGKTFLTNCIAKALLDSEHSVIYFTSLQLFDTLSKYEFDKGSAGDSGRLREDIFNCDLLVIDDIGTEIANSFTASQMFLVINERDLRKKSTIISSNLSLSEISEKYTDRISSRIFGNYRFISPDIDDIRVKIRKTLL